MADNEAQAKEVGVTTKKGLLVNKYVVIGVVIAGLGTILLIGLLTGLVARPNNCIKPSSTTPSTTSTTPSTTTTTPSTTTPSTTTPSTTTPSTTTPSTTTTTPSTSSSPSTSSTTATTTRSETSPSRTLPTPETTVKITTTSPQPEVDFRLPSKQSPVFYNLHLNYDYDPNNQEAPFSYKGSVELSFQLNEATNTVMFHASDELIVSKSDAVMESIDLNENAVPVPIETIQSLDYDMHAVRFSNNLTVGVYTLKLSFAASPLYRNVFLNDFSELGAKKILVATRFVPTGARAHFPCFDEPGFKAPFEITIEHPAGTIALSNGLESKQEFIENGKTRQRTKFEVTPQLNTQSVAWTILPDNFAFKTVKIGEFKQMRIYGRRQAINDGEADFALDIAKKLIEYFIDYFGISQAEPEKIDLVAVPNFKGLASPTAGLNLFHEENILFSDKVESIANQEKIAIVIGLDMANYWFANYISAAWWDDLWLTEGLAIFYAYRAVNAILPDKDIENVFITSELIQSMWQDGFSDIRPLKFNIKRPEDILRAFEPITYSKGCALFRMLESIVQEGAFNTNIMRLFDAGVTTGVITFDDLANTFEFPADYAINARDFIERWVLQKNFPVVGVYLDQDKVEFVQDRFLIEEVVPENDSPFHYVWDIYLQCRAGGTYDSNLGDDQHITGDIYEFDFVLNKQYDETLLPKAYTWIKCNKDFKGYYLSNYRDYVYDNIEIVLNKEPDTFSVGDRANLIHTAFETAFIGVNNYDIPAKLLKYMSKNERSFIPWRTLTWHMEEISTIAEHRQSFRTIRDFNLKLAAEIDSSMDIWDDNGNDLEKLFKLSLIDFRCRMQDPVCLNKASSQFNLIDKRYFATPYDSAFVNPVKPNHRALVYKYHMQNTYKYLDWIEMQGLYGSTTNVQERYDALHSLANTRHTWLIDRLLHETIITEDKTLKLEDIPKVISYVGKNPTGRHSSWAFVRYSWQFFETFDQQLIRDLTSSIGDIAESFDTEFLLKELVDFFDSYEDNGTGEIRRRMISNVQSNIRWVENHEEDLIRNFIRDFNGQKSRF